MINKAVLLSTASWLGVTGLIILLFGVLWTGANLYKKSGLKTKELYDPDRKQTENFMKKIINHNAGSKSVSCSLVLGENDFNVISKNSITENSPNASFTFYEQSVFIHPNDNSYENLVSTIKSVCEGINNQADHPLDNIILCIKAEDFFFDTTDKVIGWSEMLKKTSLNTNLKLPCYLIITDCQKIRDLAFLYNIKDKTQMVGVFTKNAEWQNISEQLCQGLANLQYINPEGTAANINAIEFILSKSELIYQRLQGLFNSPLVFCRGIFLTINSNYQGTVFSQHFSAELANRIFIERFLAENMTDPQPRKITIIKNYVFKSTALCTGLILLFQGFRTARTYNAIFSLFSLKSNNNFTTKKDFQKFSDLVQYSIQTVDPKVIKNLLLPQYMYSSFIHRLQQSLYSLYRSTILQEKRLQISYNMTDILNIFSDPSKALPLELGQRVLQLEKDIDEYNNAFSKGQKSVFNSLYEKIVSLDPNNKHILFQSNSTGFTLGEYQSKLEQLLETNLYNWAQQNLPHNLYIESNKLIENLGQLEDFLGGRREMNSENIISLYSAIKSYISLLSHTNVNWINNKTFNPNSDYFSALKTTLEKQNTFGRYYIHKIFSQLDDILFKFKLKLLEFRSSILGGGLIEETSDLTNVNPSNRIKTLAQALDIIMSKFPVSDQGSSLNINAAPEKIILWKEMNLKNTVGMLKNMQEFLQEGEGTDKLLEVLKKIIIRKAVLPQVCYAFNSYESRPINYTNLTEILNYWSKTLPNIGYIINTLESVAESEDINRKLKELLVQNLNQTYQQIIAYINNSFIYNNFYAMKNWDGKSNLSAMILHATNEEDLRMILSLQFEKLEQLSRSLEPFLNSLKELNAETQSSMSQQIECIEKLIADIKKKNLKKPNAITELEEFFIGLKDWNIISILDFERNAVTDPNNIFQKFRNNAESLLCKVSEKNLQAATKEQLDNLYIFFSQKLQNKFPFNKNSLVDAKAEDVQLILKSITENYLWLSRSVKYFGKEFAGHLDFLLKMVKMKTIFDDSTQLKVSGTLKQVHSSTDKNVNYIVNWCFNIGDSTVKYDIKNDKFQWSSGEPVSLSIDLASGSQVEIEKESSKKQFVRSFEGPWALLRFHVAYRKNDDLLIRVPVYINGKPNNICINFAVKNIPSLDFDEL